MTAAPTSLVRPKDRPHQRMAGRPHFAALDGFRGILALTVAIYHTIWLSWPNSSAFLNNGAVIIDLFFAFSGFLMVTLYRDSLGQAGQARAFMVRRFARLYPLHVFMLGLFVAFSLVRLLAHEWGFAHQSPGEILPFESGAVESLRNLAAHLTLTHAAGGADALAYNPPSWTVGAEFMTYIVFALGMLALAGRRFPRWGYAVVIIGIAAIYTGLGLTQANMDLTHDLGVFRCLAGFAIGGLAASLRLRGQFRLSRGGTIAELATLAASIAFVVYAGGKGQFFVGPVLFIFILVFSQDSGAVSKFLSARSFMTLARLSYSVYLTHVLIAIGFDIVLSQTLGAVMPDWNTNEALGTLILIPYLATVLAFSALTYRFIEVPGRQLILRLFARKPATVLTAAE